LISMASDPLLFLAMVAFISLSGVLAPGPLFATTIARGYGDGNAGLKVSFGHAVVELPLIAAIFFGLDTVLRNDAVFVGIGLIGGAVLAYLGMDMIRNRRTAVERAKISRHGSFISGAMLTAVNPYWLLWWATVGATLVAGSVEFGLIMLPAFAIVHLSCDFVWYSFVGFTVHRSKSMWSERRHHYLFLASGAIMLVFGAYFVVSSVLKIA
jgi:threonine/homoserine/homoserine lactone efflux protein